MPFVYAVRVGPEHVGRRVTIRSRIAEGGLTDTLGVLESCDEDAFEVRTRRGELVRIARPLVVAARVVEQG